MSIIFRKCRINGEQDTYKAARCVGKQPESDFWIFGPELQLNGDGEIVNEEVTSTIWVQTIFDADEHGLGNGRKRKSVRYMPSIKLPLNSLALGEIVKLLLNVIHNNGTAGVFTIGKFGIILNPSFICMRGFCMASVIY